MFCPATPATHAELHSSGLLLSRLQQPRDNLSLPQHHWKVSLKGWQLQWAGFWWCKGGEQSRDSPLFAVRQWPESAHCSTAQCLPPPPSIEASLTLHFSTPCVSRGAQNPLLHFSGLGCIYWRSGVLGKHGESEMLWELLSVTGSYSFIGTCTRRHSCAPHSCLHPRHWIRSSRGCHWDQSPAALLGHSKVGRAPCSPCSLGEYARKGHLVLWVGMWCSNRDEPSSLDPGCLPSTTL